MSDVDRTLKDLKREIIESPIRCVSCDQENRTKEFVKMVLFLYDKIFGLTEEGAEKERNDSRDLHEICFEEIYKERDDKIYKAILEGDEDNVFIFKEHIHSYFTSKHMYVFDHRLFKTHPMVLSLGMYKLFRLYKLHTTGIITLDLFKGIENFEIN